MTIGRSPLPRRRVVLFIHVGVVAVCGLRREQDPVPARRSLWPGRERGTATPFFSGSRERDCPAYRALPGQKNGVQASLIAVSARGPGGETRNSRRPRCGPRLAPGGGRAGRRRGAHLADMLHDHRAQGMDSDTACALAAQAFAARTAFTPEACSWVVGELAAAVGFDTSGEGQAGALAGSVPPTRTGPFAAAATPGTAPSGTELRRDWQPTMTAAGPAADLGRHRVTGQKNALKLCAVGVVAVAVAAARSRTKRGRSSCPPLANGGTRPFPGISTLSRSRLRRRLCRPPPGTMP